MKRVVFAFAAVLCCMFLLAATSSPIKLKPRVKYEDRRSVVPEMTMEYTGDNILVFSSAGLYDAVVVIRDSSGDVVCTESFAVHPEQPYILMLPSIDAGEYEVGATIGDCKLYGEFLLE